jgi:hypothetical protein
LFLFNITLENPLLNAIDETSVLEKYYNSDAWPFTAMSH